MIEGSTIYIGTINNIYEKFSQQENEEDNNFIYSRINTVCSYTDRDEYPGINYTANVEYLGKFLSYSSNQTPGRTWYNEAIWNLTHTNSLNYPFPYKWKDDFSDEEPCRWYLQKAELIYRACLHEIGHCYALDHPNYNDYVNLINDKELTLQEKLSRFTPMASGISVVIGEFYTEDEILNMNFNWFNSQIKKEK